jgi:DNA-binding ferritin-like protein
MLEALLDLWACLRASHHVYWTLHWQSKGNQFYGDHLLFERLYSARIEEIDGLAEVIAGHYGADKLNPVTAWAAASKKIDMATKMTNAIGIAQMVLKSAEAANKLVDGADCPYPGGLQNFIQGISTTHIGDLYLLKQRFGTPATA